MTGQTVTKGLRDDTTTAHLLLLLLLLLFRLLLLVSVSVLQRCTQLPHGLTQGRNEGILGRPFEAGGFSTQQRKPKKHK